jgi:hypothetical protein
MMLDQRTACYSIFTVCALIIMRKTKIAIFPVTQLVDLLVRYKINSALSAVIAKNRTSRRRRRIRRDCAGKVISGTSDWMRRFFYRKSALSLIKIRRFRRV